MKKLFSLLLALTLAVGFNTPSFAVINSTFGTGLNATSNADPNSLTTKNPFPATFVGNQTVSAAWTSQASPGFFPRFTKDATGLMPIQVHYVPSNGAAVTYTVKVWMYDRIANKWSLPNTNGSTNYTGEVFDTIAQPNVDAIYLQISTISAGTLSVYFDTSNVSKK